MNSSPLRKPRNVRQCPCLRPSRWKTSGRSSCAHRKAWFCLRPRREFVPSSPQIAGLMRSEEHTSELQSLMRISYAVFCLKKKKNEPTEETKRVTPTYLNDKTTINEYNKQHT